MKRFFPLLILGFAVVYALVSCNSEPTGNVLKAEKIKEPVTDPSQISALFANNNIEYHSMGCLNWPDSFPYNPNSVFAIAHTDSQILIDYKITETPVIGTITEDLGSVWQESCAEIFIKLPTDSLYYNVECNCIGTILLQSGQSRSNRIVSSLDNVQKIKRWASLGRDSIATITEDSTWELSLIIPVNAFWRSNFGSLSGKTLNANVYHCIGSGDKQCYQTWAPISTEKPDFHRPEFFQPIYFK